MRLTTMLASSSWDWYLTKKRATYEDLERVPDHQVAELLDGELIVSPRPSPLHGSVQGALLLELGPPYQRGNVGPGGWLFIPEPELHLGLDVVVPDVAGWRTARLLSLPPKAGIRTPPDWVCEALSPSTARIDRFRKLPIYAREGVPHLWLIDPLNKTLEVFRPTEDSQHPVAMYHGDTVVRVHPFEAAEIDLGSFWNPLRPINTKSSQE